MKITRKQLRKAINEELSLITEEAPYGDDYQAADDALKQAMRDIKESAKAILIAAGFPVNSDGMSWSPVEAIVKTASDRPGAKVTIEITTAIQAV